MGALTSAIIYALENNKYNVTVQKLLDDVCANLIKQKHTQIPICSSNKKISLNMQFFKP